MKKYLSALLFLTAAFSMSFKEPNMSIYNFSIQSTEGETINIKDYKGKKILFVNVASKCGYTKQYKDLQALYEKYQDKLVIIGFPCNQFGGQEPGTEEEIQAFCEKNFGVTFPLTEKINVKGGDKHEIYQWLTEKEKNGVKDTSIKWNFFKFLVDEEGKLIESYGSRTNPMDEEITQHLK